MSLLIVATPYTTRPLKALYVCREDTCIFENTLVKLWKENCPIVKRERSNCAKRPMNAVGVYKRRACRKKTCVFVKWDMRTCEKRPVNLWKETCKRVKENGETVKRGLWNVRSDLWKLCVSAGHLQDKMHSFAIWLHVFICEISPSYVTWRIAINDTCIWPDSFICDMTHSYLIWLIHLWHDSFVCDMTHSYVARLIHIRPPLWIM